jgi:hypothetical protein
VSVHVQAGGSFVSQLLQSYFISKQQMPVRTVNTEMHVSGDSGTLFENKATVRNVTYIYALM